MGEVCPKSVFIDRRFSKINDVTFCKGAAGGFVTSRSGKGIKSCRYETDVVVFWGKLHIRKRGLVLKLQWPAEIDLARC